MSAESVIDCLSCKHYKGIAPGTGMCRAHPPHTQIVGTDKFGQPMQMSLFPQVSTGTVCGEHALKFTLAAVTDVPAGNS